MAWFSGWVATSSSGTAEAEHRLPDSAFSRRRKQPGRRPADPRGTRRSGLRAGSWDTLTMPRLGISMDAGVTFDDNVSRAEDSRDKISDRSTTSIGKRWINIYAGSQTRAVGECLLRRREIPPLLGSWSSDPGRTSGNQYRSSATFLAPTLGLFTPPERRGITSRPCVMGTGPPPASASVSR